MRACVNRQIVYAGQLLTVAGWRRDAHVVVDESGRIVDIADGAPQGARCVDVLLPGLGNVHSHSFQRALAGVVERRAPAGRDDFWTWRKLMYRFLDRLSPDDVEAIAAQAQMEMLEAGYSAVGEFHYLHHQPGGSAYDRPAEMTERLLAAAAMTGIGYTHLPVLYMRGGLAGEPLAGAQLRFGCGPDRFEVLYTAIRDAVKSAPADSRLGVAPHSLRAVSPEGLATAAGLCTAGPVHMHVAEQAAEVEDVRTALGTTPVRWLLDNGGIDGRWCLIHATHATADELQGLAAAAAVVGVCPMTEANLGDGIFDAPAFTAAGGRIAIGTDSNTRIAVAEELRLLEYSQRLRLQRRAVLANPGQSSGRCLYEAAAAAAAQALGRDAGRIEIGACADLVALGTDNAMLHGREGDTVLDSWIFAGDDRLVSDVWSAGRHVVADGRHRDRDAITRRFLAVMDRLLAAA
jgi:formimidoylglutamate deiminase